jgi:hypothetical protein
MNGDSRVVRMIIEPAVRLRAGWRDVARRMAELGEDVLLNAPTPTRFDAEEWTW